MSSFTNVFGGNAVKPSQPSYEALTISANTALLWPLEAIEGTNVVAALVDVTATANSLELMMPVASEGSVGVAGIFTNVGTHTFTLTDTAGNTIATIASTQQWIIALIDNSTTNGTWRAYQLGSTTSSAVAAALAGPGLQVAGGMLETYWGVSLQSGNVAISATFWSTLIVFTGTAPATFQLQAGHYLTDGFFCAVANLGTAPVTITGTNGETVNNLASVTVPVGGSGIIVCTVTGGVGSFYTIGALVAPLGIDAGGTGATTAAGALTNLGGTSVGTAIFTAPTTASVLALLGIKNFTFTTLTVSTNQVLAANSTGTIFVCNGGPLSLTIPLTTTLTPSWCFGFLANGNDVTLIPQAADRISNGTAGASVTVPNGSSGLVITDASGNLWVLFQSADNLESDIPWVAAQGSNAITANYLPQITALYDGLLLSFRAAAANTSNAPTFSPNGLTAYPITYAGGMALLLGAIPGQYAECLVRYNLANTRWELLNPAVPLVNENPISVAGSSNVTLTEAQVAFEVLSFYGALSGDITAFVPPASRSWVMQNLTTGAFTLTVQPTAGSSSLLLTQGYARSVFTDGVHMYSSIGDPLDFLIYQTGTAYEVAGTFTLTVPATVYDMSYQCVGGGGGGGATTACSSGTISVAPGGNGGTQSSGSFATTPGGSIVVTVGTGGAGGIVGGANGAQGGSSEITYGVVTITAPGGHGGPNGTPQVPPAFAIQNTATSLATGGVWNTGETYGQPGIGLGTTETMGGAGGGQGGAPPSSGGSAGAGAVSFGAGGAGANTQGGAAGNAGGNGGGGVVTFSWVTVP